jgi:hypothetical protein
MAHKKYKTPHEVVVALESGLISRRSVQAMIQYYRKRGFEEDALMYKEALNLTKPHKKNG